jgi:hypothetical protein
MPARRNIRADETLEQIDLVWLMYLSCFPTPPPSHNSASLPFRFGDTFPFLVTFTHPIKSLVLQFRQNALHPDRRHVVRQHLGHIARLTVDHAAIEEGPGLQFSFFISISAV